MKFFARPFFGLLVRNFNHYTTKGSRRIVNFYSNYVLPHFFFLFISDLIFVSHIEPMSTLGWLITGSVQWMNADFLSFLMLEFSFLLIMHALSHWNLCFCSHECSLFCIYLFFHLLCSTCVHLFLFVRVCMHFICIVFHIHMKCCILSIYF